MSKFTASLLMGLLAALSGCATTAVDEHAAHQSVGAADPSVNSTQGMSMQGMPMQGMQQNMQQMREQMAKIHATSDPAERQRLMGEHQHAMQAQMKMMHSMMDAGSNHQMGGHMMGGKGQGQGKGKGKGQGGMMNSDMMQHHQMMMGRMDMMQSMMEQMMEHMAAENPGAPSDAKKKP